jgi:hypothetical protein
MVARADNAWRGIPRVENMDPYIPPGRLGARRRSSEKLKLMRKPVSRNVGYLRAIMPSVLAASEVFGVLPDAVLSRDRHRSVARARFLAMAICRAKYGWSLPEVGRAFGRDHTTALHAIRVARYGPGWWLVEERAPLDTDETGVGPRNVRPEQ